MKKAAIVSLALVLAGAMFLAASNYTYAQDEGQRGRRGGEGMRQGGGPGGGPGGMMGGQFDPERMREMMSQRMKDMLQCSDDEWEVIGPRFEKVAELQMRNRMGMMGRRGMRPGGPGMDRGGDRPQAEGNDAAEALQQVLMDQDSSADDIKAKLEAFRAEKKAQEAELEKAQASLRELLSVRQEAQLVLMGTLD